jgi:5-formyltetrahydrofolate cyclo-ligase
MIFDSLGLGELGVIFVLIILLVQPKQLGRILKALGKFKRKVTQIQNDVKSQLNAIADLEDAKEAQEKLATDKMGMRRWAKDQVAAMTAAAKDDAAQAIARTLADWPGYRHARTVSCFVGNLDELDTMPILRQVIADGKTLLVPYVRPDGESGQPGRSLGMAKIADPDRDLTEGAFRILEPRPELREAEPPGPDLVLVPGLCFDSRGGRLGKGLGFYDKYLSVPPALDAAKVGLGFDVQITQKNLILESHDQLLDAVLTEKRFLILAPPRPEWSAGNEKQA